MDFGSIFASAFGKTDNGKYRDAAKDIRGREKGRQNDIRGGKKAIDQAFGQFDGDYYRGMEDAYTANYMPQIDKQYGDANGKMLAALAGRGTLESTVGIDQMADLKETRDASAIDIAGRAQDEANNLRINVDGAKTNLYGLNKKASNPKAMGVQAQSEATALQAPKAYTPLGNAFAAFAQPLAQGIQAKRTAAPSYTSIYPGAGSGKVIG